MDSDDCKEHGLINSSGAGGNESGGRVEINMKLAEEVLGKAFEHEEHGRYQEALKSYELAVKYLICSIKYGNESDSVKIDLKNTALRHLDKMDELKEIVIENQNKIKIEDEDNTSFLNFICKAFCCIFV